MMTTQPHAEGSEPAEAIECQDVYCKAGLPGLASCDCITTQGQPIRTEDRKVVHEGDRIYDYYSCKWGTIRVGSLGEDGWFTVDHEDGGRATLNGERISTYQPAWAK